MSLSQSAIRNPQSAIFALVLAFASLAPAGELFVAQKDPGASDKNPGTEAKPLATIQAGVDKAQVGDTIYVKGGDYEETVDINKPGDINRPTVLTAWKNDRVRIGYRPKSLPVAGKWEPVPGSKSWKVQLLKDVPDDFLVLVNQERVVTYMQDAPVKDDMAIHAAYRKSDHTLMFNANGKDPATLGTFEYGRRPSCLTFFRIDALASGWIVRKMEFSFAGMGMYIFGGNCTIEDCFFTHCYRGGIFMPARMNTIRRCCFHHCGGGICGSGIAHLIEDNIIVECGQTPENDILIVDIPNAAVEGSGPTTFKGNMMGQNFLYNIVSDNPYGAGWYADCSGSQSSRIVGNAFWDNPGGGIYNEACVDDTIAQGNVFYRNGASSSVCARWNVIDNLFFESGVMWNNQDLNPVRDTYNLLRGNAFINPKYGYLSDFAAGWGQTASPECFRGCMVDHNRIWATPDTVLINDGGEGKKYKSLEDIRKEFGWEIHGKVQPYDPARDTVESVAQAMGGSIVTFRIPWGKHSAEARPMLANTHVRSPWPGSPISADPQAIPTFFWRVADGNYDPNPLWNGYGALTFHQYWLPSCCVVDNDKSEVRGCRWYVDADPTFPDKIEDKTACRKGHMQEWGIRTAYATGKFWLVAEGLEPDKMLPQGVGYWSPCLGAASGAKVTISLKMRGKGLVSTDKGSPAVWLQFTNETGQNRTRSFLAGKDDAGKMHREELTKGDYDWTDVTETITAPEGAARMSLFFGIGPCKGKVDFDDIEIHTASEAATVAPEILHPRLPLERIKQTVFVDLSKVANRGLADEVDNDGKGGWSDQGPNADMREFKTGHRDLGGVNFNVLPEPKPNGPASGCIVVLRSENRAKGDLPEKVTIPVGKKLDTLFFLHSAAWCPTGGNEAFRYVIHYKDGKDVTLPVTGNNLADWTADPVARFPLEEGTFSTVADTVKNPQFRQGSVYRMEWSSPRERRGVEIESIEFIGAGKAVPILLAITGVVEW